jgi:hypothetical protein
MLKSPSYAILELISSLFGRFFNGEVYIDVGVITPTWQSNGTRGAIVYTWQSTNP